MDIKELVAAFDTKPHCTWIERDGKAMQVKQLRVTGNRVLIDSPSAAVSGIVIDETTADKYTVRRCVPQLNVQASRKLRFDNLEAGGILALNDGLFEIKSFCRTNVSITTKGVTNTIPLVEIQLKTQYGTRYVLYTEDKGLLRSKHVIHNRPIALYGKGERLNDYMIPYTLDGSGFGWIPWLSEITYEYEQKFISKYHKEAAATIDKIIAKAKYDGSKYDLMMTVDNVSATDVTTNSVNKNVYALNRNVPQPTSKGGITTTRTTTTTGVSTTTVKTYLKGALYSEANLKAACDIFLAAKNKEVAHVPATK